MIKPSAVSAPLALAEVVAARNGPDREPPTEEAPLIEFRGVSRRYEVGGGEVVALNRIHLRIDAGEFVVIRGPSGSGKTTLLNVVGALDTASSGEVLISGREVTSASRGELSSIPAWSRRLEGDLGG